MGFRRLSVVLAILLSCLVVGATAAASSVSRLPTASWRTVTFLGVSLQVPASWPVLDLARNPRICPRLDRHAVYLGLPGPDPACPAAVVGKTGTVQVMPIETGSPDVRAATRPAVIGSGNSRVSSNSQITHTIIEIIPAAGVEVSLSYGTDLATIRRIQRSVTIVPARRRSGGQPAASPLPSTPAAPAAAAATPQGLFHGAGFDTCAAPSASTMSRWLASPYRAIGIYIGGINRGCAQANLTAAWIDAIQASGWHYFPFYVGLQASCVQAYGDATIVTAKAAAEGKAAADDAAAQAKNLGIPLGTPIIYDMEAYAGCGPQVIKFLSAWDSEVRADGYKAGVYESFSNIGDLISAEGKMTEPDVIHYADWDGKATTRSSYMPATLWANHQRLHQYQGGHYETWGGATMNIDNDQLDVNLGGAVTPLPLSFRIAVGMNANGTAEWFARAANGAVLHSYQHPVGSTTWAATSTVGDSPHNLVSDPAVSSDQNGNLTLFAVTARGAVMHAWQQLGAPDNWMWGGAVGSGSPGTIASDPAAIAEPGGAVGVFVTNNSGAVVTTQQTTANANTSWTRWTTLGGSCASAPVPFTPAAGHLSVACVAATGSLAVTSLSGGRWTGWQRAGRLTGLTGTPAVLQAPSGQTDIFATTTTGGLDEIYQPAGSGTWTVSAAPRSLRLHSSPSVMPWPGGGVAVFSQLANSDVGYIVGNGASSWSAWTDLRAAMLGTPAAWIDTSGEPQAAILTGRHRLAVAGFAGGSWTSWTSLAGGF